MSVDKNGVSKDTQYNLSSLRAAIRDLRADLEAILDQRMPKLPTIDRVITVDTLPKLTPLPKQGYRKSRLLIMYPTSLIFNIPRIGQFTIEVPSGWIQLNLPEGSSIALTSKQTTQ